MSSADGDRPREPRGQRGEDAARDRQQVRREHDARWRRRDAGDARERRLDLGHVLVPQHLVGADLAVHLAEAHRLVGGRPGAGDARAGGHDQSPSTGRGARAARPR